MLVILCPSKVPKRCWAGACEGQARHITVHLERATEQHWGLSSGTGAGQQKYVLCPFSSRTPLSFFTFTGFGGLGSKGWLAKQCYKIPFPRQQSHTSISRKNNIGVTGLIAFIYELPVLCTGNRNLLCICEILRSLLQGPWPPIERFSQFSFHISLSALFSNATNLSKQRETLSSVLLGNLFAPLILASDQPYWKYVFKCYFHTKRKTKKYYYQEI